MTKKLSLLLVTGFLALVASSANAQQVTQKVGVCDPTAYVYNCLKPNADGSINTAAGGTTSYVTTDKGGTITAGGVAQVAIASNAARKAWCIQNDPAASEALTVRLSGTASATSSTSLSAGQQACNQAGTLDTSAVSVFAATTGHRWFGFEGQ